MKSFSVEKKSLLSVIMSDQVAYSNFDDAGIDEYPGSDVGDGGTQYTTTAPTINLTTGGGSQTITSSPLISSLVVGSDPLAPGTGPDVVGFKRAKTTAFDDATSKLFDATSVAGCQLLDEIIRDLQSSVSHYNIPASTSCADFYAWLDNRAAATVGTYMNAYQTLLTGMGLGALPDNMGDQLTIMRDAVLGVIRAAVDPVCANPSTPALTKVVIQQRLKQLQGSLCSARPDTGGVWPKIEKDPLSGVTTVVTADGQRIKINLDNSADNTNNIANVLSGNQGSSGLDPNVLAALLLARSTPAGEPTPDPSTIIGDVGSVPPETAAPPEATLDLGYLDATAAPAATVNTLFGLGPIGLVLIFAMLIAGGVIVWRLRKSGSSTTTNAGGRIDTALANTRAPIPLANALRNARAAY